MQDTIEAHGTTWVRKDLVKERYDADLFGKADTEAAPTRFEDFWKGWPRRNGVRSGRKQAQDQYSRAVKAGVSETTLIDQAKVYAEKCGEYPKDCFRWIRDKNYADEIESVERKENSPDVLNFWADKIRSGKKLFGFSPKMAAQLIAAGMFSAQELTDRGLL